MRVFHNTGWPHYKKCLSIIFSSAACGSHVFHPTATTAAAPEEAKDDSSTAVNPPLPPTSSSFSVTAMDVDTSTNHPLPLSSIKRPHSPTISESDKVSLAMPTAFLPSDITSITTAVTTYERKGRLTACTRVQYWASLSVIVQQSSNLMSSSSQCSSQRLLECLLLGIVQGRAVQE